MATELLEVVSARVPQDLMRKLEKMAEEERRPISHMTRYLLEEAISARAKKVTKKQ